MSFRVLYLHEFGRIGGAEQALLRLVEVARPAGVEPIVVWPRAEDAVARLSDQGISIIRLTMPRWRRGLGLAFFPVFLLRLRRKLAGSRIDMVHVNNYRSAPLGRRVARWARVPCVCTVRETIAKETMRRYGLRKIDAIVAVSEATARDLIEGGVARDRIHTVRSGVPLFDVSGEAERCALRQGLGIAADAPVIGIVAHILPHKGFDELVRAMPAIVHRFPRVRCVIVGEAPRTRYLNHLFVLADGLGVKTGMVWAGRQENVSAFLRTLDVFVLPSHTEGLPLTVLEAMAAGKPVVATAVGGIPEAVVDGVTGLVMPPRDPQRLAEAIMALLADPTLMASMGEAGRDRARKTFSLEKEAQETRAVYARVLAERSS